MNKFQKTINLWANGVISKIERGELVLQPGQWVQCGEGKKSRFIGVRKGVLWVAHWQGSSYSTNQRFNIMLKAFKGRNLNEKD